MKKGKIIVVSGPSGVGKSDIITKFINLPELNLSQTISMTTRPRREEERDGISYDFVSREYFEQAIQENKFVEYTEFLGNYYGTPVASIERVLNLGKNVLIGVEASGVSEIEKKYPDCVSIFIVPSSLDALEKIIRSRRDEKEEVVQHRLAKAANELNLISTYKFVVNNDDTDLAAELCKVIIKRFI